jgi:hypothetical protein
MKELIIKRHVKSYEIRGLIIKEHPTLSIGTAIVESTSFKIDGRQRRFLTPKQISIAEFNLEPVRFCLSTLVRSENVALLFSTSSTMIVTLQGNGFEMEAFIDSISTAGEYEGILCVEICLTPV